MQTLRAPDSWRAIDFISDLHLGGDTPRTFAAWQRYLEGTGADAVLILGDLFEVWVGDDARAAGFEAEAAAVLTAAAARRPIGFMVGNRDFLVGPALLGACGLIGLEDPTLITAFDTRVLVSHGDAMCLGDRDYQAFRRMVRDAAWQRDFLDRPLAERQARAREMRDESARHGRDRVLFHDVDPVAALTALEAAQARTLVHGHTHRPGSGALGPDCWRHVLSDWDLDNSAPGRAEVLRWQASGFSRLTPDEAGAAVG